MYFFLIPWCIQNCKCFKKQYTKIIAIIYLISNVPINSVKFFRYWLVINYFVKYIFIIVLVKNGQLGERKKQILLSLQMFKRIINLKVIWYLCQTYNKLHLNVPLSIIHWNFFNRAHRCWWWSISVLQI